MNNIKKILLNRVFIICMAILIVLIIYLYNENTSLKLTRYEIDTNISKNFKIAQVSDYHNTKSNRLNKSLINKLTKENPNIIVITGDLIDSTFPNEDISLDFIKKITDIAPIYYVNGNHEARYNGYVEFESKLYDLGVNILNDRFTYLDNYNINIIGVRDPNFTNLTANKIKNLMIDGAYNILLSHRPELFTEYVEANVDLVYSGHAHGGQIRIPFTGGILAPDQGFFPKYDSGLYEKNNTKMIVSRGIGNSIFPFRVNNNPELIITNLI